MVYKTPFQAEDENDGEKIDALDFSSQAEPATPEMPELNEPDDENDDDTDELSARSKGPALDFSAFADPIKAPPPPKAPRAKSTLDFSSQADPATPPTATPLPRARPQVSADVPMPQARPASAPAPQAEPEVPLPTERPDIGSPAPADYVPDMEAPNRSGGSAIDAVLGPDSGMLSPDEGYKQREARVAAAEKAVPEKKAALDAAQKQYDDLIAAAGLTGEAGDVMVKREMQRKAGLGKARTEYTAATKELEDARKSPLPTQQAWRDKLERVPSAVTQQLGDTVVGASRLATGALNASNYLMLRAMGVEQPSSAPIDLGQKAVESAADNINGWVRERFKSDPAQDQTLGTKLTQGVISTGVFAATGAAGRALGLSPALTTAAAGALPQAEQQYQQALRQEQMMRGYAQAWMKNNGVNLSEDQANGLVRWGMFLTGLGIGATEAVPIAHMFDRLEKASGGGLTRYLGIIGAQAGEEGVQEGVQQLLQNTATRALLDPNQKIDQDVADNALVGALSGAIVTGAVSAPAALRGDLAKVNEAFPASPETPAPVSEDIVRQASEAPGARGDQGAPAATATAGPYAGEGLGEVAAGGSQKPVEPSADTAPTVSATERRVLRKKGYNDEQIDAMSRAEADVELGEAADQGIEPEATPPAAEAPKVAEPPATAPDQPTAEPASDIEAQARDLQDRQSDRNAVWLPRATVEHLRNVGKLEDVLKAGVPMENFDGEGGILVAKNMKIARTARKLHTQKISLQAIVGGLTGAGNGKPADAQTVVQQTDAAGNVTQESAVSPGEGAAVAADMTEPGRQVEEKPVAEALAERAAKVAAEEGPAPGFVRFYHGGDQQAAGADGGRWLTPDPEYARGYAEKNGGRVYYVDIPETSPLLRKSFDDTGTDQKAPYVHFNAPESVARNLKPVPADFSSQAVPVEGAGTRQSPAKIADAEDLARAESRVNTEPTEAQKEAGNYKKGHLRWGGRWGGLSITVENPKGSVRSGTGPDGKPWQVEMPVAYGYIKGSKGKDGDHIDVFLGPQHDSQQVFVINQINPATGGLDEHKVMLGFPDADSAKAAYDASFSDGSGPERRKLMRVTDFKELKEWLRKGDTRRAFRGGEPAWSVALEKAAADLAKPVPITYGKVAGGENLPPREGAPYGVFRAASSGLETPLTKEGVPDPDAVGQQLKERLDKFHDETMREVVAPAIVKMQPKASNFNVGDNAYGYAPSNDQDRKAKGRVTVIEGGKPEAPDFSAHGEPVSAPPTSSSAAPKEKKTKKPKGPSYIDRLEHYFRVGRIYKGYMGFDKVLGFERLPDGGWQVRVQEIKNGETVGAPRTHMTAPSKRDLEAWEKQHPVPVPAETDETTKAPETGPSDSEAKPAEPTPASKLADKFIEHFREGGDFKNILVARKMAKEGGFEEDAKAVEEAMELAVVKLGREIVAGPDDAKAKFTALVDLYSRQPKLGTRTSTSMRDQAFSTPVPLAFVASRLADIAGGDLTYEPTAGNGALLLEADTARDRTLANEVNPERADNLRALGFQRVTTQDATEPAQAKVILGQLEGADRVIANPPFGPVRQEGESKVFDLSDIQKGYQTKEIDHAIVLRALEALRDDGRAALIIGGINKLVSSPEARSDAYNGKAKREFFKVLYDRYNVVDHLTVAGELYERQGAGWPVDVIVIDGRGKSKRALPAVDVPRILSTWGEIGELLDAVPGTGNREAGNAVERPAEAGSRQRNGRVRGGGERVSEPEPAPGQREPVQSGPVERPRNERPGDEGRGERPAGDERRDAERTRVEPPPERRASGLADFDSAFDQGLEDVFGPQEGPKSSQGDNDRILPEAEGSPTPKSFWEYQPSSETPTLEQAIAAGAVPPTSTQKEWDKLSPGYKREIVRSKTKQDQRQTTDVAKSAAKNAAESADAAMAGLVQLFGGGKTVSSGLSFDEDTYTKAKPLFVQAAQKFIAFKDDMAELVRRMVGEMHRLHGLTRDALEAMRPYLRRFMEDVQAGVVSLTGGEQQKPAPKAAEKTEREPAVQEQETATQVAYAPKSGVNGLGTLVPVNMRTSIQESLAELESRVGNLDKYVAGQLGYDVNDLADYFAAEQVDALALAIDNLERGKGFIIGDQTGIGKGRVNAAIIRWAIKRGRIPTFVTEKPNLYRDMYRDLTDIGIQDFLGHEPRILATNSDLNIPLTEDGGVALRTGASADHGKLLGSMTAKKFANDFDMVFTTYSQMQTVKGQDTTRRAFLAGIAPDAVLIFDESHNAGGQGKAMVTKGPSNRSGFARDLVASANGVFYSSATYAKRPDVMDLYAATDMVMAVEKVEDLAEAIAKGGVPMQQVVAAMLAKAGQYIRRERSFAGITYDTVITPVDKEQYDGISSALAAIQDFSLAVADAAQVLDQQIKAQASAILGDNATGSAGASSTLFTSIMHNIVNQMLLAMKAKGAAELAIETLRRGEKPIFTVANTMESFLTDYAAEAGIAHGDVMDVDFSQVLRKYLDRTRTLILKRPFSDVPVERKYLADAELGKEGRDAYKRAVETIERLDLRNLPVSPIDRIKQDLADAGYKVGEITGRGTIIDYSGDEPVLRGRPTRETSIKGRILTNDAFNAGELDAILLNQAGSTGLSLHASKKFKDQRKRLMLIVQPEGNIDTQMQLLGRPNRTGQVVKPGYGQLVADIPAEKRPAAVLAKKMASLNANTTASRGGALTAKDVPDFLNEYGDKVAATIIGDDPDLNRRLGSPVKTKENGSIDIEDAMRRLTGRIPLLPLAEQEELYERLEQDYLSLLEQMEAAGENALEAKTLDLKARPLDRVQVVPPKPGSKSPFAAPVFMERTSILRQGKPFSADELAHRLLTEMNADVDAARVTKDNAVEAITDFAPDRIWGAVAAKVAQEKRNEALDEFNDFLREEIGGLTSPEKQEKEQAKLNAVKDRWLPLHTQLPVGARITLKTNAGNKTAFVISTERTGKARNPLALSSWKATFAVADGERQLTVPFSRLYEDSKAPAEDKTAIELSPIGWLETPEQTVERFAIMQNSAREERYIATGNLLAAYDWLNMRGRIINYTDEEGHIRQGILTSKGFDVADHFAGKARAVRDPAEIVAWLKNNPSKSMYSEDDVVRLDLSNGRFFVTTEAPKRTGGIYYLDKKLTELIGNDFYKRGPMVAEMWKPSDADMTAVVKRLQELGAVFVDRTETTLPPTEKLAEQKDDEAKASIERPFGYTPTAERKRQIIERAVIDAVAQVAGIDAARRTAVVSEVQQSPRPDWNVGEENRDFEVTAAYFPRRETSGVNPLIMVSLAARDAIKTAYHEGWHAIEGTLSADEVQILTRETPRLRDFVAQRNPGIAGPIRGAEQEEVWAESAALYTAMRERGEPISGIHIAARRVFEKIRNLLTRIKNALAGLGFKSASDIFEDFARGEMASRRAGLAPEDRRRWWQNGQAPRASIRRRRPTEDDLLPPPETAREAWDPTVPFKQRLSDTVDALLLNPARAFWDRQIDLLRFQKASEAMGRRVGESLDTYLAATLYPGKVGERMKDTVKKLWEPVYDAMAERGMGRDELHDFLYARHAPERNAAIRKIDPQNDAGSGMTDQEAAEIMTALAHRRADFDAVADLIDKIVEANRDVMLREGLESERTIEQWERAYSHYVPLKGWETGTDDLVGRIGSPSSGVGFDVRRSESERALGRASRADDILANLFDQTQRTIIRAEKNRVAKTFLRFAQANPSPFYKIGSAEKKRHIDPLTGMVEEYWTSLPTHLDRVFAVKVGGKTHYIEVMHEGLLEALKSLGADKMNAFIRVMGRLTREYSRFQTAKNPEFVFTNIIRDIQDAGFSVSAEQQKRYTRTFFKNLLNGRALFGAILGTAEKGENTGYRRWYDEWREAGGKISHYGLKDLEDLRGEFERELRQRTESTGKAVAMAPLRLLSPINGKLVKFLEALSDVTESTTRLAIYISGREIGLSKAQAARMARSATVDFNRRGVHSTPISALYAFANANIQGNVRLLRVLRKSKIARRAALGIVVAGMLVTYWNMSVSPEDDEKKRAYEKRKYWERERNIIIYWPGSKQAAKIPLGYGLNVFWMMGEQLAMRMLDKVSTTEAIGNVLGTMVDAFNPTGSQGSFFDLATWAKGLFPTVMRPIPELALNKNWAGNRIHPDPMPWTEGLPNSSMHKAFTHPAAVGVAELVNRLSGGNKFQPGWLDPYPDDLEYGWNFAVGGLGRFIANTSGTINDMVDGVDRPVERIPFVRRFVASDNSPSIASSAYYDKRRDEQVKARQLRSAIKARQEGTDDGSADAVIEKLAPEVGARPSKSGKGVAVRSEEVFRNADKQIKALRQQEDAIRKDQKLSRGERETRIRELRDQMREIMSRARSQAAPAN